MKKIISLAGIGFLLGVFIWVAISIISAGSMQPPSRLIEQLGSERAALIVQFALSGLYGAVCMGTTVLYDADRLPMTIASVIHCLICILPFAPMALFLGWAGGIAEVLIMAGIQLFAYFIVWLIMFTRFRKEVRELNRMKKDAEKK